MNAQNTQVIESRADSEFSVICGSFTACLRRHADSLIRRVKSYFLGRMPADSLAGMSDRLQRDIGLDDPQLQMHLFDRNFNTINELRNLERNRHLFR